jgi:hypothetical protein
MTRYWILAFIFKMSLCTGQHVFEGEIKYKLTISPKDAKVETSMLRDYYGKHMTFLFKEGNFKWIMDSTSTFAGTIYNRDENKVYYQMKNSEAIAWRPGAQVTDTIVSLKTIPTKVIILKRPCKMLEVKSRSKNGGRTRQYYYDPGLSVDPKWFAKTENGNMNRIYSATHALPLRIVDDFGTFSITYEAIEINRKKLSASMFKVESKHFLEVK